MPIFWFSSWNKNFELKEKGMRPSRAELKILQPARLGLITSIYCHALPFLVHFPKERTFLAQDWPNLMIKMIPTNSQPTFQNKMKYWYYFPLWFLVNHKNLWKNAVKKKLIHFVNPFILGHFILDWCIMCM